MAATIWPQTVYLELPRLGLKVYSHHLGDYMRRWLIQLTRGALRLHNIVRSDADPDMHDHPFDFTSFLLTGGYTEELPGSAGTTSRVYHPRFSIVRKRAEDLHRLDLTDGPVWTIVLTGPRRRDWGFMTAAGWVPWREYESRK